MFSRRDFMTWTASAAASGLLHGCAEASANHRGSATRRYHLSLVFKAIDKDPELLGVARDAGVTDIWLDAYNYGHWYETPERLRTTIAQIERMGLQWHLINLALGHPAGSLGDGTGETSLRPPTPWRTLVHPDGSRYSGTSLHPPGTKKNVAALKSLSSLKPDCVFLDDDFRLARAPGMIGGCFCDWHRQRFLDKYGYGAKRWDELLSDVRERQLSPLLRAWIDFNCDRLTACFRAQQAAVPKVTIGNMVMYLGSEKAGIRLSDYADVPLRVGEWMFNDVSFKPIKEKCNELFSALFHRRYVKPHLAYSETTAYPADQLSAANMAAKLAVSTFADVRNTMYMSGGTAFPKSHWAVLAPAMKKHRGIHEVLKGHRPQGPFKHYWGEASRYVGDDRPFSLFLALGIPFEVVDDVPDEGWVFLSDFDARSLIGKNRPAGQRTLVCRPGLARESKGLRPIEDSLKSLWALKRGVIEAGLDVPHVVEDKAVVCAWYPTANAVLLWNLSEQRENLRVHWAGKTISVEVDGLDVAFVRCQS